MYSSVAHQLSQIDENHRGLTYKEIRKMCADYLRKHADDFLPFMLNEAGDCLSESVFSQYCDKVETSAEWGGHIEVSNISNNCYIYTINESLVASAVEVA